MKHPKLTPLAVCMLPLLVCSVGHVNAQQLSLAQAPAGNGGREPAPNIIVSVDDSGSMGNAGIAALKNALNDAFSTTNVPDNSIRLGFQAMWRCRGLSSAPYRDYGSACPDTRVKRFSGTHRNNFNTWVNSLLPWAGTPSHSMIKNAGEFMKTTGIHSPFAENPGVTEGTPLGCRRSYHIFMTDGDWNSEWNMADPTTAGNADGTTRTLPDGKVYDTAAANTQTRVYRDAFGGGGGTSTLADFTFDYWATDLQPSIPNEVKPIVKEAGTVSVPGASAYTIEEYWNPKNNPATWQGLNTYTIGFNAAANLPTSGASNRPWFGGSTWSGGDYNNLLRGDVTWRNAVAGGVARRHELWHMALNGRGRFAPATSPAELAAAFNEILNQIKLDTSKPLVAISANTQTLRAGAKAFVAGYDADKWKGSLKAYTIEKSTGKLEEPALWDAAEKLDDNGLFSLSSRVVLTHNGTNGVAFTWGSLSADQKAALQDGDTTTVGQERLLYLKGDRSKEVANGGPYRNRGSRLGDIVNSAPWYVDKPNSGFTYDGYGTFRANNASRTPMVYVGANDGMLHGFSANDGAERLAYVPKGIYPRIKKLTETGYDATHLYTVDGVPFVADAYIGSAWKSLLVGTLGAGGKGYFVLDVTNPSGFSSALPENLVMMDTTDGADNDMGHQMGEPVTDLVNPNRVLQVTRVNAKAGGKHRWALIMGNGYNSTNEDPVLFVQFLDGAKELKKLKAKDDSGNGLSAPQLLDLNGDGAVDLAYAGDLKGNLWKFDLTTENTSDWEVSLGGQPLFTAVDSGSGIQPITTTPVWLPHPKGGIMLAVGTGRLLTEADRTSAAQQTLYGIYDNANISFSGGTVSVTGGSPVPGRSSLVQQTQTSTVNLSGTSYFQTSNNPVNYATKRGWYIDLPNVGERSVNNPGLYDKRLMYMISHIPAVGSLIDSQTETCTPNPSAGKQYLTIINLIDGTAPKDAVFDTNGDSQFTAADNKSNKMEASNTPILILDRSGSENKQLVCQNASGCPAGGGPGQLSTQRDQPARVGWRQLW